MRLGQQSMDEFVTKFTSLLRYVPYIWEEKAQVQLFVSSLPTFMKERIKFDNPKSMDKAIRQAKICYQQMKRKGESKKHWSNKKGQKKLSNVKNVQNSSSRNMQRKQHSGFADKNQVKPRPPSENRITKVSRKPEANQQQKPPLQCWVVENPTATEIVPTIPGHGK